MGGIKELYFVNEDPKNPGYSMTEYDLYAKLGLTLRKNITRDVYEIIGIKSREVHSTFPDLQSAVDMCNQLEGEDNTWIE